MIRKWTPWRDLESLRRELDRAFESHVTRSFNPFRMAFLPGNSARGYPLVNVYESPEEISVEALAPGLVSDSLEVTIKGSTLTISGEKAPLAGVENEQYHRNERSVGKFVRSIELDSDVDGSKVSARYSNGILLVTLPKSDFS